jgi:hypothetical protein
VSGMYFKITIFYSLYTFKDAYKRMIEFNKLHSSKFYKYLLQQEYSSRERCTNIWSYSAHAVAKAFGRYVKTSHPLSILVAMCLNAALVH